MASGLRGMIQRAQSGATNPYGDLTPEDQQRLEQYNRGLYTGPDYKGRHEANQYLESQYAQMLRNWEQQPPIDYSMTAELNPQFQGARNRLSAALAARGIGGSGVEGGGLTSLYGQQAMAGGDLIRRMLQQRQQERFQQQNAFDQFARQIGSAGLQRNWQAQDNKGGFFKDLLGTIGSIGGAILGGPIGSGIHLFGAGKSPAPYTGSDPYGQQAGASVGTIDPSYYGPYQPTDYPSYDWNQQ